MKIEIKCQGARTAKVTDLRPFQGNLKNLSAENYHRLKKEILELGFSEPVSVWDHKGELLLLNGHQRVRTLQQMIIEGYDCPEIPISVIEANNKKEAKKKILALTSQYGEITKDGLYEFMSEAEISMKEIEESFRFPEIDFDNFKSDFFEEPSNPEKDDAIPEKPPAVCQMGELWILGEHRLLCGDSTKIEDVENLMGGEKADIVFTDPPYGLGESKSFNEDHPDYKDDEPFDIMSLQIEGDFVIWGANYYEKLPMPRNKIGWIVWDKRPSRDNWTKDDGKREAADRRFGQHFEIACTNVSEARGKMIRKTWGGFYGTAGNNEDEIVHKTQKPVDLSADIMQPRHKIVLDYFGGSGSTLIACEKTKRKCFMMEIDPHYCDVIIARWEKYTGQKASKNE